MTFLGKILAFIKKLPGDLIWFAAAPKDWDPDLEDFEVKMEEASLRRGWEIIWTQIRERPHGVALLINILMINS